MKVVLRTFGSFHRRSWKHSPWHCDGPINDVRVVQSKKVLGKDSETYRDFTSQAFRKCPVYAVSQSIFTEIGQSLLFDLKSGDVGYS